MIALGVDQSVAQQAIGDGEIDGRFGKRGDQRDLAEDQVVDVDLDA